MQSTITAEKSRLRKIVNDFSFTEEERESSDRLLFTRFLSLTQVASSANILLFYGVGAEPHTSQLLEPLLSMGKHLFLPHCLPGGRMEARAYRGVEHLVPGPFGIPEPDEGSGAVNQNSLSLILVPNLCCDRHNFRLGHGGGYYDRYLADFSGFTVALCRDKLLYPALPLEAHDQPVDLVLTETQCLSRS